MKMFWKMNRPRMLMWLGMMFIWVPVLIVYPVVTYNKGTSRNIIVEVVSEPYIDSLTLSYRWTGEVYRSCDISLRRFVLDSQGYTHTLIETPMFPAQPVSDLGVQSFVINVTVGQNLPEGQAVYFAREVPRCTWLQRLWPVAIDYPPVNFTVTRIKQ